MAHTVSSPRLLTALDGSHRMTPDVWLLRDPPVQMPIVDGSVTASYLQQTARTATLGVDTQVLTSLDVSTLSDVVMIRTGVTDIEMVPVFTGRVDSVDDDDTGMVTIHCVDRGADIIRARFEVPWAVTAGKSVVSEIRKIIQDVDSSFVLDVEPNVTDLLTPVMVFGEDRGGALDELASSLNSVWTANRYGSLSLFRNPYSISTEITSVAVITDGANGRISRYARNVARENIANSVTLIVERSDGSDPIRVTERDDDPTSGTYWGGTFGKQNIIVSNATPRNETSARVLARRILNQSLAVMRTWRIETPHYPILDPGDVITVDYGGDVTQQVVEGITYPLMAADSGMLTTRELQMLSLAS